MSVTVKIPTSLRGLTGGSSEVEVRSGRLGEVITNLTDTYPELGSASSTKRAIFVGS